MLVILVALAVFNFGTILGYREPRYREVPSYVPRTRYEWLPEEPQSEYLPGIPPELVNHRESFDELDYVPKAYKPEFESQIPVISRFRIPKRRLVDTHRPFIPPAALNSEGCL